MENTDGDPVVTDVNLRTAAGMGLSLAAGWDENFHFLPPPLTGGGVFWYHTHLSLERWQSLVECT